jgi:D-alanine-D-alanine ligase-like ATP-grasp enzyme
MHVCVLSDETIDDYNPAKYFHAHEWDFFTMDPPVDELIRKISSEKQYDVYLNMSDGSDEDDAGFVLVKTLEALNLPFTGADSNFYNPTREEMQAAAETHGLHFARGFHAVSEGDLEQAKNLHYPLIVKHPNSYGSIGLTTQSRVHTFEQLQEQFRRNLNDFGAARVEEFIEGREVSCLVVDNPDDLSNPYAYPPAEVKFPPGESFLHVEVKWMNWDTFIVRLDDSVLVRAVQDVSRRMYQAMKGTGYARMDIRIRPNGELVILEINPNCGILYYGADDRSSTDLPISWDKNGHDGFLDRIFRSAILRHQLRNA